MKVLIGDSHCYPGCPVTMRDEGKGTLLEFNDGTVALGDFHADGEEGVLAVPAYETARGRKIDAKTWRLGRVGDDGSWRIKARIFPG
ncbi:hypothetical protein [Ancylobacter oerskovii]|uniref:Uncharacterized protein n=1 Tax=Ancylobacter oerskovii TaxID=459519 RepID=A0ABW4YVW5_9HYPH|nr:hypothetical protein [Ancylobacter oerskovii]MBS7544113.1 hypothetical protein [Ancylobacter oerskovii]